MARDLEADFACILLDDLERSLQCLREEGSPSSRRDVVRTAFAAIEGMVWIFREHITDAARTLGKLAADEDRVLEETSGQVTGEGKIVSQNRFIPLPNLIRLIARIAENLNAENRIDFSDSGWGNFRIALQVRHRITHPKSTEDLEISDADLACCILAAYWLFEETTRAMGGANRALSAYVREFSEVLAKLKIGDFDTWCAYHAAAGSGSEP